MKERVEKAKGNCLYVEGSICGIDDGIYKPECKGIYENDDFFNWLQIRHFKFCPYCGRKIEVVE